MYYTCPDPRMFPVAKGLMIKARISILAGALLVISLGACSGRSQDRHRAECPVCPHAEAGVPSSRAARDAGAGAETDAGAASGRRLQHFSLLSAAKAYRSHVACVSEVAASLPPELTREADRTNLAERVCQTRRALSEKSVSLCEEIQDEVWPAACRRLYAGLYGAPDACPTLTPRSQGREPACVALAARDPALCRAVESAAGRARCLALLGPASQCRALRTSGEVASCHRDRRRWRAVLRPGKPSLAPKWTPEFTVSVTVDGKTVKGALHGLEHGIVVPRHIRGARIVLGTLRPTGPLTPLEKRIRISMDVGTQRPKAIAGRATTRGAGTRLCVLYQGHPVEPKSLRGTHTFPKVAPRRGAAVAGTFTATFQRDGKTVRIDGSYRTFVRDVVPNAWYGVGDCTRELPKPEPRATRPPTPAMRPAVSEGEPCYFVAHWEGLTQVGYRVYGVRPQAACARLGLRERDVVTAVGSRPLKRWADVDALYRSLAHPGPLQVTVRRGKRRLILQRKP